MKTERSIRLSYGPRSEGRTLDGIVALPYRASGASMGSDA